MNLRESGSSKAKILAVLKRDESVEILTVKKGWAEVKRESGLQGWVSSSYLTGFKKEKPVKKKPADKAVAKTGPPQKQPEVAEEKKKEEVVTTQVKEPVPEQKPEAEAKPPEPASPHHIRYYVA